MQALCQALLIQRYKAEGKARTQLSEPKGRTGTYRSVEGAGNGALHCLGSEGLTWQVCSGVTEAQDGCCRDEKGGWGRVFCAVPWSLSFSCGMRCGGGFR